MKKLHILLLCSIFVILSLSTVSAGLFDFGESEKETCTAIDDGNQSIFTLTADSGSLKKAGSDFGTIFINSTQGPFLGYICSYDGTEIYIRYEPVDSYEAQLDRYSNELNNEIEEYGKDSFCYKGPNENGTNEWGIILSDGEIGSIKVMKSQYLDYNNEDFDKIKTVADSITFNLPDNITVRTAKINGTTWW